MDRPLVIVEFLTGSDDKTIRSGSYALLQRNRGGRVFSFGRRRNTTEEARLTAALQKLDIDGKLVLRGHGNWEMRTIGGCQTEAVVPLLAGLRGRPAVPVSVHGCLLGLGGQAEVDEFSGYPLGQVSTDSFAGLLHKRLKEDLAYKTVLFARSYLVAVSLGDSHVGHGVNQVNLTVGQKTTGQIDFWSERAGITASYRHHRTNSKHAFYWDGNTQMVQPVDYANKGIYIHGELIED